MCSHSFWCSECVKPSHGTNTAVKTLLTQRLRRCTTFMSRPSTRAISSVRESAVLRTSADPVRANNPPSRRLPQTQKPPISKSRIFRIVRCRLMNTYQRPDSGSSRSWFFTRDDNPSNDFHMSVGCVESQTPPSGQPFSIPASEAATLCRPRAQARHPSKAPGPALQSRQAPSAAT